MNPEHVKAINKAFDELRKRQKGNPLPYSEERKKILQLTRRKAVLNMELLEHALEQLKKNGFKVYNVPTKEEANKIVLEYIGSEKIVVKSKSNVTKELELTRFLEEHGIKVVETDIGDRILQLLEEKPSHPTGPVTHLSAKEISRRLSHIYGYTLGDRPEEIIPVILKEIKESIVASKVAITGANAICAEEGSIVIVHNEGNVYEMLRKEKLIVVTSIDKVYPNIEEAINMIKIITHNATGAIVPSFIEIISGITKTADIEKKFYPGIHSPKEVIVIVVDNKRTEIGKTEKELLTCIGCGLCLVDCPAYGTHGLDYGADGVPGGKGVVYMSLYNNVAEKGTAYCLSCMHCVHNCPLHIDLPGYIRKLRSNGSLRKEFYYFSKSHIQWLYLKMKEIFKLDKKFDNVFEINE